MGLFVVECVPLSAMAVLKDAYKLYRKICWIEYLDFLGQRHTGSLSLKKGRTSSLSKNPEKEEKKAVRNPQRREQQKQMFNVNHPRNHQREERLWKNAERRARRQDRIPKFRSFFQVLYRSCYFNSDYHTFKSKIRLIIFFQRIE